MPFLRQSECRAYSVLHRSRQLPQHIKAVAHEMQIRGAIPVLYRIRCRKFNHDSSISRVAGAGMPMVAKRVRRLTAFTGTPP